MPAVLVIGQPIQKGKHKINHKSKRENAADGDLAFGGGDRQRKTELTPTCSNSEKTYAVKLKAPPSAFTKDDLGKIAIEKKKTRRPNRA